MGCMPIDLRKHTVPQKGVGLLPDPLGAHMSPRGPSQMLAERLTKLSTGRGDRLEIFVGIEVRPWKLAVRKESTCSSLQIWPGPRGISTYSQKRLAKQMIWIL